ncbi:hypothetical protein C1H76_9637 [Elsinoe australis]|uniref:Uncharacterized protein n=1 Tax=Elsinoe australis TaxID=40998 RepID=A0A4U7ARM4_9PEZI|nr:hypothetical protein C1H76_9637 [Elsinoe australis]
MARPLNRSILPLTVFVLIALALSTWFSSSIRTGINKTPLAPRPPPGPPPLPRHPLYKPERTDRPPPIVDNFPLAANAKSASDLPPIPSWNRPPKEHVKESTPLFIGFTRNWLLIQQTVVSYITAGWPPEDIYVVENTGTMHANNKGQLSLQNPFYLNHTRLKDIYGVNVLQTPALFTFAQLQNFFIFTAGERNWTHYYWSHMDVLALPEETWKDPETGEFKNLYQRTLDDLRLTLTTEERWAMTFYAYDRFTLVNRTAYEEVGGWDSSIGYYGTDCDMYERLTMADMKQNDRPNGLIYDVGSSVDDLSVLYRRSPGNPDAEDDRAGPGYIHLRDTCDGMQVFKNSHEGGRNFWQATQSGGQGEPYYKDVDGFEFSVFLTIKHGENVMAEKWGHRGCALRGAGLKAEDAWRVEHDWDYWDRPEHDGLRRELEAAGWPKDRVQG